MKQVLIRSKLASTQGNALKRADVLSEADGKLRIKVQGETQIREVASVDCIHPKGITAIGTQVQKCFPGSLHALANRLA